MCREFFFSDIACDSRIFVSGLNEKMAQRFINLLLLPRIRDDIDTYQRLNFHLYQALRKALFKPGAFFKGFLLPLCESGTCTLREATIIGSVLAKNSIPVLHSCAAMLKVAEMEYTGANSIFLRVFLDKKYALPYRVVDAIVFHFLKCRNEKRTLPVLWHQALLTFVQVSTTDWQVSHKWLANEVKLIFSSSHRDTRATSVLSKEMLCWSFVATSNTIRSPLKSGGSSSMRRAGTWRLKSPWRQENEGHSLC